MPTFSIQAPDGRTIRIQAGDQATALRGAQSWVAANPKAAAAPNPRNGQYGADLRSRTQGNLADMRDAIARVKANPTDLTNAPRVLGAVANYATNAFGIPLAAGVDQVTRPVVQAANNAFGANFDTHYATDQLMNAAGLVAGPAGEALAEAKGAGGARAPSAGDPAAAARARTAPAPQPTAPVSVAQPRPAPAAPAASPGAPAGRLAPAPAGALPAGAPAAPASVSSLPQGGAAGAQLSDVEQSALKKFVRVAKPDVNAMTGKTAAYSGVGIDPTLVDTTGRRGQGVVRALASRPTPAQDAVEAFAEKRRVGLASRMSDQARAIISSDPRTPEDIAKEVVDARTAQAQKDFGPVRGDMINVSPDMADALTSPFGLRAIRTAWQRAVDPQAREALRLLYDHVNPGQGGQATGSLNGAQISVGQAQDISKALFDDADSAKDPGDSGPMKYFGKVIRDGATMQSPEYEYALSRFANASGLAEAPAIGKQLLSAPADTFAADVARIDAIPSEPDAAGNPTPPQGIALAKPGARRAIEIASGGGRPGTAAGVAQTLADAPEQQMKNAALLGYDDAGKLQNAMRLERQAVLNAANASPGAGSNTFLNQVAGGAVNGEISPGGFGQTIGSGVALLAHGNPIPGALQLFSKYLNSTRAFSDDEAAALAHMAIDPTRHADALNFIAQRVGPRGAQTAAPMMQNVAAAAATAQPGAAAQSPPAAAGPPPAGGAAPNAFGPPGTTP